MKYEKIYEVNDLPVDIIQWAMNKKAADEQERLRQKNMLFGGAKEMLKVPAYDKFYEEKQRIANAQKAYDEMTDEEKIAYQRNNPLFIYGFNPYGRGF